MAHDKKVIVIQKPETAHADINELIKHNNAKVMAEELQTNPSPENPALHTAVGGIIQDAVGEVKNALEGLPEDELE